MFRVALNRLGRSKKWIVGAASACACVGILAAAVASHPNDTGSSVPEDSSGFQVVFIDVGQGDAQLITVHGHHLLIDGGRDGPTIIRRLNSLGVTSLDAVVATHPDADHVGGLVAVLEEFQVDDIYVNGDEDTTATYAAFLAAAAAEPGALIKTLVRGDTVPLGDLSLPVLNPPARTGDTNGDSIVLRLACGSVSVLFMADAEQPAEASMLEAGLVSPVTVLKAGHHGSNTSNSLPFLQALRPEVAVISAGKTNPYGHPAPATLARLASVGASLEYTDTSGKDDSVKMTTNCSTYKFSPAPTRVTPVPQLGIVGSAVRKSATPTAQTMTTSTAPSPLVDGGYQLPACYRAAQNTCNCPDFTTHSQAQWFHDTYDQSDVNRLDGGDKDGVVCKSLPG